MDKIHAMQLFIRVAELESFSRAADTLGLPKGSVSRQIQALESHLGARLLHRTTRRVQLTQDGMVYYERAKDLLSNLEDLDGMFQGDPSSISGRLRVDMPVGVAKKLVIPQLPAFLQHYPGIEVELSSSDRLVDVVREGFDCVIRVGTLKDSGLIARPLGRLTQINCASPHYLARFGYPESLDDLADHALIHYASNLGARQLGFEVAGDGAVRWVKTGGVLTVNSTETYQAACLAGLGCGMWSDTNEIEQQWTLDRRFTPSMAVQQRDAALARWRRAVDRSRGWLEGSTDRLAEGKTII